jgi:hypothetical protein
VTLLKSFYKYLDGKVYSKKLSGFYCVVMPFFKPVARKERKKTLAEVENVLKRVFVSNNVKYDDEDVRWSHVGTYVEPGSTPSSGKTTHTLLYDLADLVSTEKKDDSFVKAHIKILSERMDREQEPSTLEDYAHTIE